MNELGALVADLTCRSDLPQNGVSVVSHVVNNENNEHPWLLKEDLTMAILRRRESEFPSIEQTGCSVGIGVATGADDIFIGNNDALPVESSRKLPLISPRDVFNNRCEEALGTSYDGWEAHRQGAFGNTTRPFLGYLMLLEDSPTSRRSIRIRSNHFDVLPEFINASYADRYGILCRKMMREKLFDAACLIFSSPEEGISGGYSEFDKETGLHRFAAEVASHTARIAALK